MPEIWTGGSVHAVSSSKKSRSAGGLGYLLAQQLASMPVWRCVSAPMCVVIVSAFHCAAEQLLGGDGELTGVFQGHAVAAPAQDHGV